MRPQGFLECIRITDIEVGQRTAVRVHMVNIAGFNSSVLDRRANCLGHYFAGQIPLSHVDRFARAAETANFGIYRRAAIARVLKILKDEGGGSFSYDKSITQQVVGA